MAEQKRYGIRVYKDGKPCLEYMFYSLKEIYERTTKSIDQKDLSDKIAYNIKDQFPEKFDHNSKYTVKIVFYPDKKETKKIAKESVYGEFNSNGVTSKYLPVYYKKDINIFNDNYLRERFHSLMQFNSRFRSRLLDFYDSSTELVFDKEGNQKEKSSMILFRNVLDIMQDMNSNVTQNKLTFDIDRLYNKIFGTGFSERAKLYGIMENEFPKRKKQKVEEKVETEPSKPMISFREYFSLPREEREKFGISDPKKGDLIWMYELLQKQNEKGKTK